MGTEKRLKYPKMIISDMKRDMLLLFLGIVLLSFAAYAQEMTFEATEVKQEGNSKGAITSVTLPNGYIQVKAGSSPILEYNTQDLRKIFSKVEDTSAESLSLYPGRDPKQFILVSGRVKADVQNKKLVIEAFGKNSYAYVNVPPGYDLYSKKILVSITKDNEVLAVAQGSDDKSTYLNVTLGDGINSIVCSDQNCRLDLFYRINPKNKDKYFINITGNAHLNKDSRLDKYKLKEGKNDIYLINVSDLSILQVAEAVIYFKLVADAKLPASSFGDVNLEGSKVKLYVSYVKNLATDPGLSHFSIGPSVSGKNVKIKSNNANILFLSSHSASIQPKGIYYFKDGIELFEVKRGEFEVYNQAVPIGLQPRLQSANVVQVSGSKLSVSLRKLDKPILKISTGGIKNLDFARFLPTDSDSIAYVESGNKALGFMKRGVVITNGGKWQDFGTSFKIPVYDTSLTFQESSKVSESGYAVLECRLSENKCYLNGKEVSSYAEQKLKKCKSDSQCAQDQGCTQGVCVNNAKCQNMNIPGMNGQIGIVFINNRAMPKSAFRDYVLKMTGASGTASGKQMFGKEPFKSSKSKFTLYYIDDANLPIGSGAGTPAIGFSKIFGGKMCPGAKHMVLISSDPTLTGSAAIGDGRVFIEKNQQDTFPNVVSHEYAHACCGVIDEYYNVDKSFSLASFKILNQQSYNCAIDDADASSKGWPASLVSQAKSNKWQGCGGRCPSGCESWLKPSKESIMSKVTAYDSFNSFTEQGMRGRLR